MFRKLLALVGALAALQFATPAFAQSLTPAQKDEVRALVREYIQKNPEIVEEALDELQRRRDAALRIKIEGDGRDFSIGPRNAKVTIVEFFDYRCPYCHSAMEWVNEVMRRHPKDVRIVFKEFPVLGPASVEAAQAANASIRQGRYLSLHRAIMSSRGELTSARIDELARKSGVDVTRMRRDMVEAPIIEHLKSNHEVASEARIEGTPAFLINGKWLRGWDAAEADRMLREALNTRAGTGK